MRSGSRAAIGHHMHAPSGHHLRAASGDHVVRLGPCWVHVETILGPCWGRLGVILGPSWAHFGSSWDHFGVTWGHFWAIRCLWGASFKARGARAGGPQLSPPNFGPKVFPGRPFWTPKMAPKTAPRTPKRTKKAQNEEERQGKHENHKICTAPLREPHF